MLNPKRFYTAVGLFFVFLLTAFYFFNRQVYFSRGVGNMVQAFEIKDGEGVKEIGKRLEEAQLVGNDLYFDYFIWKTGSREKLQAGKYELRGSMTIPEIAQVLSIGEIIPNEIKITFPEGISAKKMEEILKEKGFEKNGFLERVDCGCGVKSDYDFLKDKPVKASLAESRRASLEGYLFPDTYIFWREASAADIINRLLENFDEKMTNEMRNDIKKQNHTIFEIVTMASLLEKEVKTPEDMKIVGGIFWKRIENERPLQSCATIAYVLGKEKKQYSYDDTRTPSPYNTYINKGLPPGPINNPGMNSLMAAVYPKKTDYNYFLTDPETGKTIFSKTLEEHEANKAKYGL